MFFEKLKKYKVLLASGSKRRHELLKGLEINFEIVSQNIDETYPKDLKKQEITNYLVKKKSSYLKKSLKKNELLITADTIVWFNNFPLEKPKDRKEAFKMIQSLSNNSHEVISSVCISTNKTQKIINESTKVNFNKLSDDDILYYTGYICGEYDGFEPLDDFGMPNAGCTSIKLDSGHGDMLTL